MKQTTGRASNGDQSLLNVRDAASFLGLSKSFLDKARIRGDGPHYLKLGSRVLYRTEALQSWLAARERPSTRQETWQPEPIQSRTIPRAPKHPPGFSFVPAGGPK